MEFFVHILIVSLIYVVLVQSLNLVMGLCGVPVLGHGGVALTGMYIAPLSGNAFDVPPALSILLAGAVGGLVGFATSLITRRLKEEYLALATFAVAVVAYSVAKNWVSITGGPRGYANILPLFPGATGVDRLFLYAGLVLLLCAVIVIITWRIKNSQYGRRLAVIRDDEILAESLGIDVDQRRHEILALASFFAASVGAIYAYYLSFVHPVNFVPLESIIIAVMLVLGGMGSTVGPIVGALILQAGPELLRFAGLSSQQIAPLRDVVTGLILIVVVMKVPKGLLGTAALE